MTQQSKTLIFFGNERLVSGLSSHDAPILRALIENGYTIAAVVSHQSIGQSRSQRKLEVAQVAAQHGIPVLLPDSPVDIVDALKAFRPDAAVLVAYGRIMPQEVLDIFPLGIVNIHPSLLPKYRGSTPIEAAVANGDTETGISLMRLNAAMDEGPLYAQVTIPLTGNETKFDVYDLAVNKSIDLLLKTLPTILDSTLQETPQDNTKATYTKQLSKKDSVLNVNLSAAENERLVRAHLGFPKTKTTVMNHDITILKAHVSNRSVTPLDIQCGDNMYLSVDELVAPSGKRMNTQAFLNGYAAG